MEMLKTGGVVMPAPGGGGGVSSDGKYYMNRYVTKSMIWALQPVKTQISWASAQSDQSLHCPHVDS